MFSNTKCFLCTEILQINQFAIQRFYKIVLLYLYTKLFINIMIILYYQMCLNSEQDFTASPHEIFHETSLGPDALFITTVQRNFYSIIKWYSNIFMLSTFC